MIFFGPFIYYAGIRALPGSETQGRCRSRVDARHSEKRRRPFFLLFVRTNLNSTIERILFSLAGRSTLFL